MHMELSQEVHVYLQYIQLQYCCWFCAPKKAPKIRFSAPLIPMNKFLDVCPSLHHSQMNLNESDKDGAYQCGTPVEYWYVRAAVHLLSVTKGGI